ncbi:MAG: OsmC family protein [Polyangiaceae bacterium]|nr:OsmC family protein [Polyangiaceae bacterium]MBK8939400.1 OsmC family protein [Polyangiaceae bacterium]
MKVTVERVGSGTFEARNEQGGTLRMDGPADMGAPGTSLKPMETVLAALAGCSGIDVVKILTQQKEPLAGLTIEVDGTRKDAIPAVFTDIAVRFVIKGPVAENKARRAVALSMEKYCSVTKMLEPTVTIRHEVVLEP